MAMICFLCDTEVLQVETSVSKGLDSVATHSVDHVPKAQIKQAALFKDLAEVLCCFFVDESAECIDSVNEHLIGSPVAF